MQQLVRKREIEKEIRKGLCDRCGKQAKVVPFKAKGGRINLCGKCILELLISFYKLHWSEE